MSNGYKNLEVWKKSYKLTLKIHGITKQFPKEETYGLISQMRRASVSINANIAEGYSTGYLKEYIRYITIAIGSNNELEVYLMLAYDFNYLNKTDFNVLKKKHEEISKMLFGLRKALRKKA
jgi:four helix bundle protein